MIFYEEHLSYLTWKYIGYENLGMYLTVPDEINFPYLH